MWVVSMGILMASVGVLLLAVFVNEKDGDNRAWKIYELYNTIKDILDSFVARKADGWADVNDVDEVLTGKNGKPYSFVTRKGDLVTLIRVKGVYRVQGQREAARRIDALVEQLTSWFTAGYIMQINAAYDPYNGRDAVNRMMERNKAAAARMGMDISFLTDDWGDKLSRWVVDQDVILALWTPFSVIPSQMEQKSAIKERVKAATSAPIADASQRQRTATPSLRDRHASYVTGVVDGLDTAGVLSEALDVRTAARVMRKRSLPLNTTDEWSPVIMGDRATIKESMRGDNRHLGYATISAQVMAEDGIVDGEYYLYGGRSYAFARMTLWPQSPKSFAELMVSLAKNNIPYTMNVIANGQARAGTMMRSLLATVVFFGQNNKMIKEGFDELTRRMQDGEPFVGVRLLFSTWINEGESLDLLRKRKQLLLGVIQQWGVAEASGMIGDPALAFAATVPGLTRQSPAPGFPAPLDELIKMLPFDRPAALWNEGSMLFRAGTKLFPYEQGSARQVAPVSIAFAPMGSGKSVTLNMEDFAYLLQGDNELPYLSKMDIGPSSEGLVLLLQMLLPADKRHLAQYHRLRFEEAYAINLFDLPLGATHPAPLHKAALVNYVALLCSDVGRSPPEFVAGLASTSIDAAYTRLLDENRPVRYQANRDRDIDDALKAMNFDTSRPVTWRHVRDALFEAELEHLAVVAQRYAVPTLPDIAALACDEVVAGLYKDKTIDGETASAFFFRKITEAISRIPIIGGISKFSVDDARVVVLDLDEVSPQGGDTASWMTAVMVMLARHILVSRFFVMPNDVHVCEPGYRDYQSYRINRIRELPKKYSFDEMQRFTKNKAVVAQIVSDLNQIVREGRKWKLSAMMVSQIMSDIPDDIVGLSYTRYIIGGGYDDLPAIQAKLGISPDAAAMILQLGKPGSHGANMVLDFRVEGVQSGQATYQLALTGGPRMIWAFDTTPDNSQVRNRLYARWGVKKTLSILAEHYPGGVVDEVSAIKNGMRENERTGAIDLMVKKLVDRFEPKETYE